MRGSAPGERRGGRQKGTPNRTTTVLKDAILKAANLAGGDDDGLVKYLETQAKENPGPFMALLGKVLPMQVTGEDGGPIRTDARIDVGSLTNEQLRALASIPVQRG